MRQLSIRSRLATLAALLPLGAQGLALALPVPAQYTVQPGDTLEAVSQQVGVPAARLAELNQLTDVNRIAAGQVLALPSDSRTPPSGGVGAREYVVRSGDTLSGIAARFGVSAVALVEANALADPNRLAVGQKLIVPGASTLLSTPASTPRPMASTANGASATTRVQDVSAAVLAVARSVSPTARIGMAARNLTTGQRADIRSSEVFPSASVNKVPIMAEVYRQLASGRLARASTLDAELERMITLSDNEAANRLVDRVGEASVNSTMAGLGLRSTQLRNYFSGPSAARDPGFNQTTPAEMATLFTLIATDRLVGPSSSQQMRGLLSRVADGSKLVRGLPPGTRVAHKSGWYDGLANDAGIVYAPRATYVLAVFTQGVSDAEAANQLVASVSRVVYEGWGR